MTNQVSETSGGTQSGKPEFNQATLFRMLHAIDRSELRIYTMDCFTVGYMLNRYHNDIGDPIQLSESFFLQPYPIRAGSLQLQGTERPKDTILYKIILWKESEQIMRGLLIGRLMKEKVATRYVVLLASDHRIYACLSSGVDEYECPYRDYQDIESYECGEEQDDIYLDDTDVFEGVPIMVDFGTLDDLTGGNDNREYKVLDEVTKWECSGYPKGLDSPNFATDDALIKSTKSSAGPLVQLTCGGGSTEPEDLNNHTPSPECTGIEK